MHWIALLPASEDERAAWGWWALQFTPRVALLDEAIVLEVQASQALFGGRRSLSCRIFESNTALAPVKWASGATSLVALALLRLQLRGAARPRAVGELPLELLTAALPHVAVLERTGCRNWGQLRALPRAGVARRFGAGLLDALDAAFGERPEGHAWLTLPTVFDMNLELPALATSAPELLWSAQRLLSQLQVWLAVRNQGVLALEFEWTLDLRRHNGVQLPSHQQLVIRTAQATQDLAHLRRLASEQLHRTTLAAPANHLRLRSLETSPWAGASTSLLPEDRRKGEKLHQLVERLSARLGEGSVVVPVACEDHRPERKQQWLPARQALATAAPDADALYPAWLLPQPLRLQMQGDTPCHGGPLHRLARLYRVEAAWWEANGPALRDYFIARSPQHGLVWIYRERPGPGQSQPRWFLQGLYA
ncbi:DNA polymerase Y family protein [uncultured Ramlibacter sp.]|uniref:DNA polymerase Y family protein n=1 Tax=uncultured Ramlibacter sp. TaxID=260755 RepID=UPI00263A29CC|nr:DNA polymerase Y family protein [uncultured Ramlibacter sp.]